jgi:hypothetical protein
MTPTAAAFQALDMPLAGDILEGADEIGDFMFPNVEDPAARRRRVYRLSTEVPPADRLPLFKIGSLLFARRSTLLKWISEREGRPAT